MYTGGRVGASTDARVFVEIFGEIQNSGESELVGAKDLFERRR